MSESELLARLEALRECAGIANRVRNAANRGAQWACWEERPGDHYERDAESIAHAAALIGRLISEVADKTAAQIRERGR